MENNTSDTDKSVTEKTFNFLSWAVPVFALVAIIIILSIYFSKYHGDLADQAVFGAFGDFVGGLLNPVFTFLTILLLIYSIKFQMDELKLTRKELKNSAVELAESNNIGSLNLERQIVIVNAQIVRDQVQVMDKELNNIMFTEVYRSAQHTNVDFITYLNFDKYFLRIDKTKNISTVHWYTQCLERCLDLQTNFDELCDLINSENIARIHYSFKLGQIRGFYQQLLKRCTEATLWEQNGDGFLRIEAAHKRGHDELQLLIDKLDTLTSNKKPLASTHVYE
jgi:hypothetical protein